MTGLVRAVRASVAVAALVVVLAGCQGDSTVDAGAPAASEAPASSAPAAASPAANAGGGSDCKDVPQVAAALKAFPEVTKVTIIGSCTQASVTTNLPAGSNEKGKAICDVAAVAAYANGLQAVNVDAADGSEIGLGVKGSSCIGG